VNVLFPDPPRDFRGRRKVKMVRRAAHVLCAGVLVGAYVFAVGPAQRETWLIATISSGALLLALDLHETAAFLLQVRGLFLMAKISVVIALPWLGGSAAWVLATVLGLSVISSHAPSRVRYRFWVAAGRVRGSTSKG